MTTGAAHLARRPAWSCRVCDTAWPCAAARESLLIEYAGNRVTLSVYLCSMLYDATSDLHALHGDAGPAPRELYARFIGWVPR
ncbi:hypothetical protein [Plantactinospora sp. CA-290183]|uniref:hypothetical protein n=1 Tax=Plantactinospora sp. CA-290183 TaxID=3240006 RepID=UPI003D8F4E92